MNKTQAEIDLYANIVSENEVKVQKAKEIQAQWTSEQSSYEEHITSLLEDKKRLQE
jgi:hypothetical protein